MTISTATRKPRYLWPVVVKILLDLVAPTAGYYTLRGLGMSQIASLCVAALPAVVYYLYRLARGRKVDAFETFLLLIIAASDGASFINGNPRLFLSVDGWTSFVVAIACYVSLWTRRPLVFLLVRSLLDNTPLRVKHRTAEWDGMWERDEKFHRPWIVSTVVWGILNGLDGIARLFVAFTAPIDQAPGILGLLTITLVVITQVWQTWYLRRCFRSTGAFVSALPAKEQEVAEVPGVVGLPNAAEADDAVSVSTGQGRNESLVGNRTMVAHKGFSHVERGVST